MTFHCVDDGVPEATTRLLRAACAARGVAYVQIDPRWFDFDDERQLQPGALLFRPAISMTAIGSSSFSTAPAWRRSTATTTGATSAPQRPT